MRGRLPSLFCHLVSAAFFMRRGDGTKRKAQSETLRGWVRPPHAKELMNRDLAGVMMPAEVASRSKKLSLRLHELVGKRVSGPDLNVSRLPVMLPLISHAFT